LLPAVLAAVMMYADFAATFGFIPILAKQLGGTDVTLSMIISLNFVVIILGNLIASTIADWIGHRRLVYFGFGLLCLSLGLIALAPSLIVLFIAQFCIGMAYGINNPVLMGLSIRYVSEAERTTAMGLHQSVYAIGMFAGPWLSGILASAIGLRPMFGVTAFFCLVVGFFLTAQLDGKKD
jgi:MFS family permease